MPTFKQSLSAGELAKLPKKASYDGKTIPTSEVEDKVPAGAERESVSVELPDGRTVYPWRGIWVTEYDDDGNVVTAGYGPDAKGFSKVPKNAMARWDLPDGVTDFDLEEYARAEWDEEHDLDEPGPTMERRKLFDRVTAAKAK